MFCFAIIAHGQIATNGDFRSVNSGSWSDVAIWQIRDAAGNWTAPATPPTSTNNVYVQKGHTVTVDVAGFCNDLHLNVQGVLSIGTNTVSISGKIRADSMSTAGVAVTGAVDATFYSDQGNYTTLNTTMVASATTGGLKFVGTSRTINNATEWNSNGTGNVSVIFALDAGATGTVAAGFKAKTFTFLSGTISTTAFFSSGAVGTGTCFTIKNGSKFTTSRSGSAAIGFSSTKKCDNVILENGGTLEFSGTTPNVDCASFTNNGTIIYLGAAGSLAQPTAAGITDGAVSITSYKNLFLSGTGLKTIPSAATITVSDTMKFTSSTCYFNTGGSISYGANAYLQFALGTGTTLTLPGTSIEWPSTGAPKNIEIKSGTVKFAANTVGSSICNRTISDSLIFTGGIFNIPLLDTLFMANGSKLFKRSVASGSGITYASASTAQYIIGAPGGPANPQATVVIDVPGGIVPENATDLVATNGLFFNLTITTGTTYNNAAKAINTLNNSGVLAFLSTNYIIYGDIIGDGTISSGSSIATTNNLNLAGALTGAATSKLNFTPGFDYVRDLTINRTGTGASITLGTNVNVWRDLFLTAGTLNDGGKAIYLGRHISYSGAAVGTGNHVSLPGGKIVMLANNVTTGNYVGCSSIGNLEINYNNTTKSLRAATSF